MARTEKHMDKQNRYFAGSPERIGKKLQEIIYKKKEGQ